MTKTSKKLGVMMLSAVLAVLTACQAMRLRPADLLFHAAPAGNAITAVTPGCFDHVAIVLSKDSVIEATGRGVVVTHIDSLRRQAGSYVIARVRNVDRRQSLRNARRYLGRRYDWLYLPDNDDIYCSELVQLAFVDSHNAPLFGTVPMTFRDSTGHIPAHWQELYDRHGLDVPEGEPGSNPSELSQRAGVRITGRLRPR